MIKEVFRKLGKLNVYNLFIQAVNNIKEGIAKEFSLSGDGYNITIKKDNGINARITTVINEIVLTIYLKVVDDETYVDSISIYHDYKKRIVANRENGQHLLELIDKIEVRNGIEKGTGTSIE